MLRWQHSEDRWINDVRLSYEDVAWSPQPAENGIGQQFRTTTRNGSSVSTFDLFRTGAGLGFQDKGQKGWTIQDDFTWTGVENHTFKVGAKAKWVTLNSLEQNLINPLYLYDTTLPSASGFNDQIPTACNSARTAPWAIRASVPRTSSWACMRRTIGT